MKLPVLSQNPVHNRKQYMRELRAYLSLLLIPLILGVALFFATRAVIRNQIQTRGELTVQSFQIRSAAMLGEAEIVAEAILHDSDFRTNSSVDEATGKSSAFVTASIGANGDMSHYVDSIYVINEKQGKIYSSDGSVHSLDSLDSILQSRGLAGLDYSSLEGWSGVLYANYAPPLYARDIMSTDNHERIGTILVLLNRTDFLRMLHTLDAECFCLFNDEFSISTILEGDSVANWQDEKEIASRLGTPVECIYVADGDYTYMAAISTKSYHAPMRMIIVFFGIYVLLVLSIGLWNFYSAVRQRSAMVDSLIRTLPMDRSVDEYYDEYYEDAITEVRSSLENYRRNDKSRQERERAYSMRHLLLGHYKNVSAQQLKTAGIPEIVNSCYVVTLFVSDYGNISPNFTAGHKPSVEEQDVVDLVFHSALKRIIRKRAQAASVELFPNYAIVLCPVKNVDPRKTATEIIVELMELLENSCGFLVQAMISQPITDPAIQLSEAYTETQRLHSFVTSIDSEKKIVFQEDLDAGQGNLLDGDYMKQLQILTNTLIAEKYDVVPAMVEGLLRDYVTPLRKDYVLGQHRLEHIANLLMEALRVSSVPGEDAEDDLERIQLSTRSVASLNAAVSEVFSGLAEKQNLLPAAEDPVSKACAYIKENLGDANLTVPLICEAMGISVQHLSRLFRQKKNITIMDYLNSCRISLAKTLLEDRTLTVAKIAEMTGYSSTVTFTRNFRRREGLTPTEYRNLHF